MIADRAARIGGTTEVSVLAGGEPRTATVEGGVITALSAPAGREPAADATIWVPGFVDLHCHGGGGFDFADANPAGVAAAVNLHRERGTRSTLLSLVSAPVDALVRRLRELREIVLALAHVAGVHLEGPFLAPGRRGAHDPGALCTPTPQAVSALLEAGEGLLRQVTIAPEFPGSLEAIDAFVDAGVVVAVGHTQADQSTAAAAFDRGASMLTHAFNAMPGLGHREPGPIGAALDRSHVTLELIADGFHVHPTVVKALFAGAPGRIALVTDSMSATGLGDGRYRIGSLDVEVRDGRPLLVGTDTLAGSTLTMGRAVEVAINAGIPFTEAVAAASTVPARALRLETPQPEVGVALSELTGIRPQ